MASSLSGVGQQQVSVTQPFLPGGNEQTRVQKQEQEQRRVEAQVNAFSSTTDSRETERSSASEERTNVRASSSNNERTESNQENRRGSVVNLLV